jgi:glycosyltransferase involved in cell wall biosynthesis
LVLSDQVECVIDTCVVSGLQEPLIVVGIPAFNEEKTIASVIVKAQMHAHIVVVCDDGSSDLTATIAHRLGAVVVRHERNLGYGAALQSLFKRARELSADVLVTLDSDGQHDASEIPILIKPIEEKTAQVVFGSRFIDKNGTADMPTYRKIGIKVITNLANGSAKNSVSDSQSGFRAYSKQALEQLSFSNNGMAASLELMRAVDKSGLEIFEVPISCKYNCNGVDTSSKNPIAHGVGLAMALVKLIVEDRPLMLLGLPGIVSLMLGVLFGFWMIDVYVATQSIVTNIALASLAFLLIGFFMMSTAITLYAIARLGKNKKTSS